VSADFSGPSVLAASSSATAPDLPYLRPTQRATIRNYAVDTFGLYPIVGAAVTAGINQYTKSPPEWNQGAEGYAKRFGSDFGIDAVQTTARYGLGEVLREDTMYYRCACRGVFPRMSHAMFSTFTARSGTDGHRVFSIPVLVAPYAGSMAAVYGWYPDRFGAKDGLRIGSYNLLAYIGGDAIHEFFHIGRRSMMFHARLKATDSYPSDELKP